MGRWKTIHLGDCLVRCTTSEAGSVGSFRETRRNLTEVAGTDLSHLEWQYKSLVQNNKQPSAMKTISQHQNIPHPECQTVFAEQESASLLARSAVGDLHGEASAVKNLRRGPRGMEPCS
jgi:hypothetical protein